MTNTFNYSALPDDSIRLLKISSNAAGDIFCEVSNFIFAQAPRFYALSYTWGTDEATESILCNGLAMQIKANLHDAIRTLFSPPISLDLPIWIDAVCINQHDDEEKAVQVSRMGDIYRKAHQVVAWLGPSGQDSDLAMDWFERLTVALPLIQFPPPRHQFGGYGLPEADDTIWPAIGNLFRRPWFGRLWTFQEAVLAADLLMICGHKTISSEILIAAAKELRRLSIDRWCVRLQAIGNHEDGFRAMEIVDGAKRDLKTDGQLSFPNLLAVACSKLCLDPRDRAYGMLGMTGKGFQDRIQVSYSNDPSQDSIQTSIDCAKACIGEGLPAILRLVAGRQRVPGLPSWCPNLNSYQYANQLQANWYRAGLLIEETEAEVFRGKTTAANNHLVISGFQADTVSETVAAEYPSLRGELKSNLVGDFLTWEAQCLALAQKITSETVPMGHIFTLTGDTRQKPLHTKDEDFHQAYVDLLANMNSVAQGRGGAFPPKERRELFHHMANEISGICRGRRYFGTEKGCLGVGPLELKKGDTVCVLYGTKPPYVLREVEEKTGEWSLIGDAFVHGLMELGETLKSARGPDEVFTIV
ncbi:heterokaryon incompatibility protein-domain-containing protein [Hyaloscypha finlandica]|nr:heterokaryon incompatibility protein-domain-containing protein [Hyaloscypha finlandica]